MRRRQRRAFAKALRKLQERVAAGRLKKRDKILEAIGRLKGAYPKAHPFVDIEVTATAGWKSACSGTWTSSRKPWPRWRLSAAQQPAGWSAQEFWETYIQLTVVEKAFRVLKSELSCVPSGITTPAARRPTSSCAYWPTLYGRPSTISPNVPGC